MATLPLLIAGTSLPSGPQRQRPGKVDDFIAYWTAAHQVVEGKDPYAEKDVLALERPEGFSGSRPLIMRNPPWVAAVVAAFGLLPFAEAQDLWLVISVMAILLSARWLWGVYRVKGQSLRLVCLAMGVFVPVAAVLTVGQIGALVLLGIAGFLHFEKQGRLGWAGAFLFLVALKPHLAFLLWAALILWSIKMRAGRILAGLISVTLAASLVALALDHSIFSQYFALLTRGGVLAELTPTLGGLLRLPLYRYGFLQSLPAIAGLAWFLFYWRRSRDQWQWRREAPMLLLVSLLTTPYAWFFDQVVLLPCVFQASAWLTASRRLIWMVIAGLYLSVNVAALLLIAAHRTAFWYVWIMPAWVAGYALVRGRFVRETAARST